MNSQKFTAEPQKTQRKRRGVLKKSLRFLCVLCGSAVNFLLPLECVATDLAPWHPKIFEFQPSVEVRSQHSRSIASDHGTFLKPLHANFINCSLAFPYYNWCGELELLSAASHRKHFDSATVTARYQLSNDVPGESFFSSVAGLSITSATRNALYDLSSFHHGKFETLLHLSVGKEMDDNQFWDSRIWGALGFGIADVGSPWAYFKLCAEKNYSDRSIFSIFLDGLYGFGKNALSKHKKFHGFGSIQHRSIDFCSSYSCLFEDGQKLSLGCRYRVYARNFPDHAISVFLTFLYPFGL